MTMLSDAIAKEIKGRPVPFVDADNKASRRVAEQTISDTPKATTDKIANVAAFQYIRKIS